MKGTASELGLKNLGQTKIGSIHEKYGAKESELLYCRIKRQVFVLPNDSGSAELKLGHISALKSSLLIILIRFTNNRIKGIPVLKENFCLF